jgi:hypothetical protein
MLQSNVYTGFCLWQERCVSQGSLQEDLEQKLCDTRLDIVSTYQPQQKILEWPRTLSPREYSI